MPITTYPLPLNPSTGQQPFSGMSSRNGPPPASNTGAGGVSRDTLKSLQDVAWSDDEDDPDCILCAEPLDLADQNFKPCQCGLQICQFCYNKLLQTDPRCPGCRRPYDEKTVEFQPVDWEEVKRAKEKKARKAKTIKQLDGLGRRHLLNVRIIMRNTVYVTGMKLPASGDEAIPVLRTNEYFGQYGKISKLQLKERSSGEPGIYIVYVRREDAARAISALDGVSAPGGPPGTTLKATYGTTRYCDSFLRGQKCDLLGCMGLHEWAGENDSFSKDDMETAILRPAEYDAKQKQVQNNLPSLTIKSQWPKPSADDAAGGSAVALPSTASWGKHIGAGRTQQARNAVATPGAGAVARPGKAPSVISLTKNTAAFPLPTPSPLPITIVKEKRKANAANAAGNASGSAGMVRQKSSDSAMSGSGATSSAPASPKKKGSSLFASTVTPSKSTAGSGSGSVSAVPPPPGLASGKAGPSRKTTAASVSTVPEPEDVPETTTSADSEAGPSTASPAPQTPAVTGGDEGYPPPPLVAEPIFLHSPYEEPSLDSFSADTDFDYSLGMDEAEIKQMLQEAGNYRPSPFSRMLLNLVELGIQPDIVNELELFSAAELGEPSGRRPWHGVFHPFDANIFESLQANHTGSGMTESDRASHFYGQSHHQQQQQQQYGSSGPSSSRRTSVDHDVPRTASRFDFARQSSTGTPVGRNSMTSAQASPFAILQRRTQMAESSMSPQYGAQLQQQQQPHPNPQLQQHQQMLQAQLRNGGTPTGQASPSAFAAPPGFGNMAPPQESHSNGQADVNAWNAESSTMGASPAARQSPLYGKQMVNRDGRSYGGKSRAVDMDEFDPALAYPPASSRSTFRTLFSPEHDNPNLPRHASPSNAYHSLAQQQQQQQPQHSMQASATPVSTAQNRTTPGYPMDARTLQQYHAMRAVSPTPASSGLGGGYARRY